MHLGIEHRLKAEALNETLSRAEHVALGRIALCLN